MSLRVAFIFALVVARAASCARGAEPLTIYLDEAMQREEAHTMRMTARVIVDRAFVLARDGELERAINLFGSAVEFDPSFAPAFYYRAGARLRVRDFTGAIPDLDRVIELDPNYAIAWNDRGYARRQIGDLTGALADFDQAIVLQPDLALGYANRAELKSKLGDTIGEFADAAQALQLDPSLGAPSGPVIARRIERGAAATETKR